MEVGGEMTAPVPPGPFRFRSKTGLDIIVDTLAYRKLSVFHTDIDHHWDMVEATATDPDRVVRSQRYDNRHAYIRHGIHPEYPDRYVVLIVQHTPLPGRIITGYTTPWLSRWQKGVAVYERA